MPPIVTQMDPLAVDGELELVRILEPAHDVQVGAKELHLEDVLAVERKRVATRSAADRAERQTVDVLVLREVLPDAVGFAARRESSGSPTASALIFLAADR